MSAPKIHFEEQNTPKVIDYWPSWSDNWDRTLLKSYLPGQPKDLVNVINIAFALPDQSGNLTWDDDIRPELTKDLIQKLRKSNKKVLIAVGGATAHDWNLESAQAIQTLAQNIKKFIDAYGLDGVDIDYELTDCAKRNRVSDLIFALRKILPQPHYKLTFTAWSIGAYGKENPGHEHPEWGGGVSGNSGIDIKIIKESDHCLDWINVMSYDVFDRSVKPAYNPVEAIEAYSALVNGKKEKIVLGIELGNHGWPADVKTTTQEVKPWMEYAVKQGFGGFMFWVLAKDVYAETGEKPGAFLDLTKLIINSIDLKAAQEKAVPKKAAPKSQPDLDIDLALALSLSMEDQNIEFEIDLDLDIDRVMQNEFNILPKM